MNNYEFCISWVLNKENTTNLKVLDYGCGSGIIVKELLKKKIQAYGCDLFYEAGDRSSLVTQDLFDNGNIKKMENSLIPFEEDYFDLVVNNQVMEHVNNLDLVVKEINRVLKPGGEVLSLFPYKGTWREGHCGIAFLHWFPKNSRIRLYFAIAFRSIGFGHFKEGKSIVDWSKGFCKYLDDWTHYRTLKEIENSYLNYFIKITHIEDYWLIKKFSNYSFFNSLIPVVTKKAIVTRLAGLVFVARK